MLQRVETQKPPVPTYCDHSDLFGSTTTNDNPEMTLASQRNMPPMYKRVFRKKHNKSLLKRIPWNYDSTSLDELWQYDQDFTTKINNENICICPILDKIAAQDLE